MRKKFFFSNSFNVLIQIMFNNKGLNFLTVFIQAVNFFPFLVNCFTLLVTSRNFFFVYFAISDNFTLSKKFSWSIKLLRHCSFILIDVSCKFKKMVCYFFISVVNFEVEKSTKYVNLTVAESMFFTEVFLSYKVLIKR